MAKKRLTMSSTPMPTRMKGRMDDRAVKGTPADKVSRKTDCRARMVSRHEMTTPASTGEPSWRHGKAHNKSRNNVISRVDLSSCRTSQARKLTECTVQAVRGECGGEDQPNASHADPTPAEDGSRAASAQSHHDEDDHDRICYITKKEFGRHPLTTTHI